MEQLQSHIWRTASSFKGKYWRISSYTELGSRSSCMTLQLLHFEFLNIWGKFSFLFYQCGVDGYVRVRYVNAVTSQSRKWLLQLFNFMNTKLFRNISITLLFTLTLPYFSQNFPFPSDVFNFFNPVQTFFVKVIFSLVLLFSHSIYILRT